MGSIAEGLGLLKMAVHNEQLVVAGDGSSLDVPTLFRWDGECWNAVPGLDQDVYALAVHDGSLIAAAVNLDSLLTSVVRWVGIAWHGGGANFG